MTPPSRVPCCKSQRSDGLVFDPTAVSTVRCRRVCLSIVQATPSVCRDQPRAGSGSTRNVLIRTVTTPALAAKSTLCEELRCEHAHSRHRIDVTGSPRSDRRLVQCQNVVPTRMISRQSGFEWNGDSVGPQRLLLHFPHTAHEQAMVRRRRSAFA